MKLLQQILQNILQDLGVNKFFKHLQKLSILNDLVFYIFDDKDNDGLMSAFLMRKLLLAINPTWRIKVYHNDDHGVTQQQLQEIDDNDYALIIIVDSSTNDAIHYKVNTPVYIIDHHEITVNLDDVSENVTVINSKLIDKLHCISACAFCYFIIEAYKSNYHVEIEDYNTVAAMSCYSDIVPVDDTVQLIITTMLKCNKHPSIIGDLNLKQTPITRSNMQFYIIPLVNYTRRLQDKVTLKAIVTDNISKYTISKLIENRNNAQGLIKNMLSSINSCILPEFDNFLLADITPTLKYQLYPIENFKGVICNQLQNTFKKPAVVGYYTKDDVFSISVRSSSINSLHYFKSIGCEGGGHKPACGFRIYPGQRALVFSGYNNYLSNYDTSDLIYDCVEVNSIRDISKVPEEDLEEMAIYNEYCYSNIKAKAFHIKHFNSGDLTSSDCYNGFKVGPYTYRHYGNLNLEQEVYVIPTLISYKMRLFELTIVTV